MKANEMPEKLYIHKSQFWGLMANEHNITKDDVEYIRTDAFIEKVCKYFRTKKKCVFACIGEDVYHSLLNEEEIEDFKKAMKEE